MNHVAAAALAAVAAISVAPAMPEISAAPAARLEIRTLPFVDLYFYVRALAVETEPVPELAGLREAVDAVRALGKQLTSPAALAPIEGAIANCATAAEAREATSSLPEKWDPRPGSHVMLRKLGTDIVAAIAPAEPAFLEKVWPEHQGEVAAAMQRIDATFAPKSQECLAYVAKSLGLAAGDLAIPVRLVAEMPFPGAVTQRGQDDRGVCFVAVRGAEGTQLFETILHEATHALDVATPAPPADAPASSSGAAPEGSAPESVLADLRARLEKTGLTRADAAWRDVPHTLMFVQAGETIRRIVDERHEHYGTVARYYAKVQAIADVEIPAWTAFLDGKATREETLSRIVAAAKPSTKPARDPR